LLSFFVVILFLQIALRMCFNYVIPWSEEISRFAFVWFVFFGAAYAARLAAHNRVMIQFKLFPKICQDIAMVLTDCIWIGFNVVMIKKSIETIRDLTEFPYMSPALEWSMAYVYWIFPISFGLMIIRIIQVNIMRYVLKIEIKDVDSVDLEETQKML
jgi:TRAP-type C4-dicarboxylate transport system permease small subunit